MIGAIIGDIAGSMFEFNNTKAVDGYELFSRESRFTDDTVMTIATAAAIIEPRRYAAVNYAQKYKEYGKRYPRAGYGHMFRKWIAAPTMEPYGSFGNGSAMRVSPIGYLFNTLEATLEEAKRSAEVTHNHPEGIKGAQAIAGSIYIVRTGGNKSDVDEFVTGLGYDTSHTIEQIRPTYRFDSSCQGSVPQAIMAFLESTDFENAIRLAISLGGDSDTIACMTGSIACEYYFVPEWMEQAALNKLDAPMRQVVETFRKRYCL